MSLEKPNPAAPDPPTGESPQVVGPILCGGTPDWDAVTFDVLCSRCGYNLRTLTRPLCTECGLEFDWAEMLDQAAFQTDFLFEQKWRERPIRSWLATVWRSFRPRRFWSEVSLHAPIKTGPLWFMMATSLVLFLVALHGLALLGSTVAGCVTLFYNPPSSVLISRGNMLAAICGRLYELAALPLDSTEEYCQLLAAVGLTWFATLVLLSSLRQTLGRCRVRTPHVLRLVAYSMPPVLVLTALWIIGANLVDVLTPWYWRMEDWYRQVWTGSVFCPVVFPVVYLGVGLRHYLRLPRPWRLAVVAVAVAALFTTTVLMTYQVLLLDRLPYFWL